MLQFTRLQISGFKSFVEGADLPIEPGLTGIVGPNGCGKSNLVEAIRWAMGETSPKQIRGREMDDVIFGGTTERPARNVAEVVLSLDNRSRAAPARFNEFEGLDISRRIEREMGSTYRVNGKEVRARDVHVLFADSATGARSTALVSQGRVGAVINAKPTERRMLLEEAAGITGLHSRRHEAELRLRAAEANLARLDDVLVTLDAQLQGLKKQARQATRYRNLNDHIRRAEATLFLVRWRDAGVAQASAAEHQRDTERQVGEHTGVATNFATQRAEAAAGLPDLRRTEADAAAELQRAVTAREINEAEAARVAQAMAVATARLTETQADHARESALVTDAEAAIVKLALERDGVFKAKSEDSTLVAEAQARLTAAEAASSDIEARFANQTERLAGDEARKDSLTRRLAEFAGRRNQLAARLAEAETELAAIVASSIDPETIATAEADLATSQTALGEAEGAADISEIARAEAELAAQAAADRLKEAVAALARLEAEEAALSKILGSSESDLWPPLIDAVKVEAGYEPALAAALGDDLAASTDEAAPIHWQTLPPLDVAPPLPEGALPLGQFVTGPSALTRRLSQVGVVADEIEGKRLSALLGPGQRLVSRNGALWRWDGFTATARAETSAAQRLSQRARLDEVRGTLSEAQERARAAEASAAAARTETETRAQAARAARDAWRQQDQVHAQSRDSLARLRETTARARARSEALATTRQAATTDLEAVDASLAEANAALAELPDLDAARNDHALLRADVLRLRAEEAERRSFAERLNREAEARDLRIIEIDRDIEGWHTRGEGSRRQATQLEERRQTIQAELDRLAAQPDAIAAERQRLLVDIEIKEAERKSAGDRLADAENRLAEIDKDLRAAEARVIEAREANIRGQAQVEQADLALTALQERIKDRLSIEPDGLAELASLDSEGDAPESEAVETKLERLLRERDTMGPVNLRAEQEASELTEQITTLGTERNDLVQAIEKLRQGINELNSEGRERLLSSFKNVDKHFRDLFVRLFGGGRAHLALTESDDPLEAGLEIMASPPGKRLQVLSLLSGGEQAMTAIALLFAVFLTNPAPICVLDEVDAPLDESNVDRYCSLLEEIAHSGATRFLTITHNRITMSRMDRLFGVTMVERGVSQLVSVDLRQAEALRATA